MSVLLVATPASAYIPEAGVAAPRTVNLHECLVNVDEETALEDISATISPAAVNAQDAEALELLEVTLVNDGACAIHHVRLDFPADVNFSRVPTFHDAGLVLGQSGLPGTAGTPTEVVPADGWVVVDAEEDADAGLTRFYYQAADPTAAIAAAGGEVTLRVRVDALPEGDVDIQTFVRFPTAHGVDTAAPALTDEPYYGPFGTTLMVDTTAPVTTADVPTGWITSPATVSFSATDGGTPGDVTTEYRILNGADEVVGWTVVPDTGDITIDSGFPGEDGTYTLEYKSTDGVGNEEVAKSAPLKVDFEPVDVVVTSPGAGEVIASASVTFAFDVLNEDEVPTDEFTITCTHTDPSGTSDQNACTAGDTFSSLADGDHTLVVEVAHAPHHSATASVSFTVDTTAPVTTVDAPAGWITTPTDITFTVTEATSPGDLVTEYRILDGDTEVVSWTAVPQSTVTIDDALLADGHYTLEYRSTDGAGNVEATQSTSLAIDLVPVDVAITAPDLDAVVAASEVTVAFDVLNEDEVPADELAVTCTLTRGDESIFSGPCAAPHTFADLVDGDYAFTVHVAHGDHHEAEATRTFSVDTMPPIVTITSPSSGIFTNADAVDVAFDVTVADGESVTFTCETADGDAASACGADGATFELTEDGEHVISITATDTAGNAGTAQVTVTRDTVLPDAVVTFSDTDPADAPAWNGAFSVHVAATDPVGDGTDAARVASIAYAFTDANGGVIAEEVVDGATIERAFPEGEAVLFTFTVTDLAGNAYTQTVGPFNVDTTLPEFAVDSPTGSGWLTASPEVTVAASDALAGVTEVDYRVRTGDAEPPEWSALADGSTTVVQALPDGVDVHLEVRARDAAGNVATVLTPKLDVDTVRPETTVTLSRDDFPEDSEWVRETFEFTLEAEDALSGVGTVHYAFVDGEDVVDSATVGAEALPLTVPIPDARGVHFTFTVHDVAGNAESGDVGPFSVDTGPPVVDFTVPPLAEDAEWYATATTGTLSVRDDGAGISWVIYCVATASEPCDQDADWRRVDGDGARLLPTQIELPDGEDVTVHYQAEDGLGQRGTGATDSFNVDTEGPRPTVSFDVDGDGWFGVQPHADVRVTPGASGLAAVRWQFVDASNPVPDADAWTTLTGEDAEAFVVPFPEGADVRLVFEAEAGHGGRVGPWTVAPGGASYLGVDLTPPTLDVADAPEGIVEEASAVSVHVDDALSGVASTRFTLDRVTREGPVRVAEGPFDAPLLRLPADLAAGRYLVDAAVTDAAGHAVHARVADFALDFEPPVVTLESPQPGSVVHGLSIRAQASDDAELQRAWVRVDGTEHAAPLNADGVIQLAVPVEPGTYVIVVGAEDTAGRVTETTPAQVTVREARKQFAPPPIQSDDEDDTGGTGGSGGDQNLDASGEGDTQDTNQTADLPVDEGAGSSGESEDETDDEGTDTDGGSTSTTGSAFAQVLRAPVGLTASPASVIFDAPAGHALHWRVQGTDARGTGTRAEIAGVGRVVVEYWTVDDAGNLGATQFLSLDFDDGAPRVTDVRFEPDVAVAGARTTVHATIAESHLARAVATLTHVESGVSAPVTLRVVDGEGYAAGFVPPAPGTYSVRVTVTDDVGHEVVVDADALLTVRESSELVATETEEEARGGWLPVPGAGALAGLFAAACAALALGRRRRGA